MNVFNRKECEFSQKELLEIVVFIRFTGDKSVRSVPKAIRDGTLAPTPCKACNYDGYSKMSVPF